MRLFTGYRPNPPADYKDRGLANPPEQPQYQGVVFDDGSVVVRWMTRYKSTSQFKNFRDFHNVHGHPEYGTKLEWTGVDKGKIVVVEQDDRIVMDPPDYFEAMAPDAF